MTLLDFAATTEGRGLMSDDATLMPNLQALHDYVAGLHRAFTLDELCDHLEAAGATPLETVEAVEAWVAETEGPPDARLVVALLDLPNDPWHLTGRSVAARGRPPRAGSVALHGGTRAARARAGGTLRRSAARYDGRAGSGGTRTRGRGARAGALAQALAGTRLRAEVDQRLHGAARTRDGGEV
jgi:hypothetical protein